MPGKVAKIGTFSDWIGLFNDWRKEIGVNTDGYRSFKFDTLYGAIDTEEIEFGHYKGRRKWENLRQIPTQQMRDALMNMIVYQGDTEFASVEQQRNLLENAPTDWDRRAITRVMIEEMRHGWQMCALLVDHFGYSGKVEAQKMLERRAFENKRLLGAFNVDVDNWMDFFTYTDFVDRDGKFQLQMLKYSAFAPLGRSMSYMLREEAFHMGTGNDGLRRIVEAGVIPAVADPEISQQMDFKFLRSVWHRSFLVGALGLRVGHQGALRRAQERQGCRARRPERLQPHALSRRSRRTDRALQLVAQAGRAEAFTRRTSNSIAPSGAGPDRNSTRKPAKPLDDRAYEEHLKEYMPSAEDKKLLLDIIDNEKKWIAEKTGARDPLSTIGEVRKSAINI